jgi:lysophospholipase L1-like esterase
MYLDISNTNEYASGWKGVGGSRIANENGTSTKSQSLVLRYMDLPDDADLVMIAGGTNDWAHHNVDLGDFDSTDNTTFNGALNILLPGLKAKYPTIPVVMMTPIKRGLIHNQTNNKGLTLEQFVDVIIAKCRQYGVYCLDMYSNCPINPQIPTMKDLLFKENDETHPNTEGHKVMGKTVAGFIRTLS